MAVKMCIRNDGKMPKLEVTIYDYVDYEVPMLVRMSEKRKAGYKSLGYEMDES